MKTKARISNSFYLMLFMFLLSSLCGCQSDTGPAAVESSGLLVGQVPYSEGARIVVRKDREELSLPIDQDGKYSVNLKPGVYQVLMKTADGSILLIDKSIVIEDNLTISLLDVSLVPIPSVISVSVPLVYHDSAVIEWETDIESDGSIEYGIDALYGYSTYTDTELKKKHRIQLNSLRPGVSYHFRIISSRHCLESVQTFSKDYVFTTESSSGS